ncbi:MAG: Lrp/AsnC ligand binding domain-containing protein [Silvanigrellales bacterium]|jgi:Lrp/AsnC family transcriptional regulator for asnA, asnC and gidA|nr:Lrp/AsnC ligand binding domain-containing protein [Silvanigrellales bacterium]
MDENIDSLDRKILAELMSDARIPLLEVARKLKVAPGTVNARHARLKRLGFIRGARLEVDLGKLGFGLMVLVGIRVQLAHQHKEVVRALERHPEVLEAHYTTGGYSLLVKVVARDIQDLHAFLADKLQSISGVHSTETFLVLDSPIARSFALPGISKGAQKRRETIVISESR